MILPVLIVLSVVCAKRYVVLLKDGLSVESIQSHNEWLHSTAVQGDSIKGFGVAGIKGYAAEMPEHVATQLKKRKDVLLVEENQEYKIQISAEEELLKLSQEIIPELNNYNLLYSSASYKNLKDHRRTLKSEHNVIKGRRAFRKKPVKKIYRKHRKHAHPLFGFSTKSQIITLNDLNSPTDFERIREVNNGKEYFAAVERLHYPFASTNLTARISVPWGLSRLSQGKKVYSDNTFLYPTSAGKGVYVYVLDTGIESEHEELKGNVEKGINIVGGTIDAADDHGHGTHCAGIIAGKTVGVAKNARLIPVKILTHEGTGSTEFAVLGLIYVMKSHHQRLKTEKHPKAVVNMSLGGVKSEVLKEIAKRAVTAGLTIVAAGGNNAENACGYSPASISKVITVGALDKQDEIAPFSNTGSCIDVYAPGVEITSSFLNNTMKSLSGTSMAAPHVSGLAALYLGEEYETPENLKTLIIRDAYKSDAIRIASAKILNLRLE